MTAPKSLAGWSRTRIRLAGWTHWLDVWTRAGFQLSAEDARMYWLGQLDGLVRVPSSSNAVVHRGALSGDAENSLYFKRFLSRRWPHSLKDRWRPSRARRALIQNELLNSHGLLAPRPVCLLEERRWGRVAQSGLITEAIDNAPDFRRWLTDGTKIVAADRRHRNAFLNAVATEIAKLHGAGFHHGDLRAGNILCQYSDTIAQCIFLDNENSERRCPLPERWRVHNLMQLNMERGTVSLSDRLRFWKAYAAAAGFSPHESARLCRTVTEVTRKRWKKVGWL